MASPTTARNEDEEVDKSTGADMHPQALLTQEFATLTGFIANLLANLTDAPPDWRTADARLETLQRLASTRKQLASGIVLNSAITAAARDERHGASHPIGFSSGRT